MEKKCTGIEKPKGKKGNPGIEKLKGKKGNIFYDLGRFVDYLKNTFKYGLPDVEDTLDESGKVIKDGIVKLCGGPEIKDMKNLGKFIDGNNCRIQIGKMTDGKTIYSNYLIWHYLLKYVSEHVKDNEKIVIQVRGKMAELLMPSKKTKSDGDSKSETDETESTGNEDAEQDTKSEIESEPKTEEIKSFDDEKTEIEKFIKKVLGRKGKNIIIQDVSEKYSDVFEALEKGKAGIIPKEEPKLLGNGNEGIIPDEEPILLEDGKESKISDKEPNLNDLSRPLKSPLPIIRYLAYHCSKDQNLMKLFYDTKPIGYRAADKEKKDYKPGDSDADYYSVVEVGIRLFEVLNGITIQGGIGRQKVYDKIISMILFGEDRIGEYKESITNNITGEKVKHEYKCHELGNYKALEKLHNWIKLNDKKNNITMQQIYVNLNSQQLTDTEKEWKENKNAKSKLASKAITALLAIALGATGVGLHQSNVKIQKQKEEAKQEMKRIEDSQRRKNECNPKQTSCAEADIHSEFRDNQLKILHAEYDLSEYNYTAEWGIIRNKIDDEFNYASNFILEYDGHRLTAEEFMKYGYGNLINKYHLTYHRPYESLIKEKKNVIENTIKYGNNDEFLKNLSKYKIEELKEQKKYSYFIDHTIGHEDWVDLMGNYVLKTFRVYLDDNNYVDLIFAAKTDYNLEVKEDFTLENGVKCMRNLVEKYLDSSTYYRDGKPINN